MVYGSFATNLWHLRRGSEGMLDWIEKGPPLHCRGRIDLELTRIKVRGDYSMCGRLPLTYCKPRNSP